MKRLLFICGRGRLRSPTAAEVFAEYTNLETDFAGVNRDADVPVDPDQIVWADQIVVMETAQKNRLTRLFPDLIGGKKVSVLGIPDDYRFGEAALVRRLKTLVPPPIQ